MTMPEARATALPLPSRVDNFASLEGARRFANTIEWSRFDEHKPDVVAVRLLDEATLYQIPASKERVASEAPLVVGYIRASCSRELSRQRELLERAGCARVFRDLQPVEAPGWAGLLRALDILRDGDTLVAGMQTLTALLSKYGRQHNHNSNRRSAQ